MTGTLQHVTSDAPARCAICGRREAIGPCASCHRMICAECSTLTSGGTKPYAICLECDYDKGRSLRGAWVRLLLWLMLPAMVLAGATLLLAWWTR